MITVDIYQKKFAPHSVAEDGVESSLDGIWHLRASVQTDNGGYDGPYQFEGFATDTDKSLIAQIKALY